MRSNDGNPLRGIDLSPQSGPLVQHFNFVRHHARILEYLEWHAQCVGRLFPARIGLQGFAVAFGRSQFT